MDTVTTQDKTLTIAKAMGFKAHLVEYQINNENVQHVKETRLSQRFFNPLEDKSDSFDVLEWLLTNGISIFHDDHKGFVAENDEPDYVFHYADDLNVAIFEAAYALSLQINNSEKHKHQGFYQGMHSIKGGSDE